MRSALQVIAAYVGQAAGQMPGNVLVTVGSTKFDELIRAVDTHIFVAALHEQGYRSLFVQVSGPL